MVLMNCEIYLSVSVMFGKVYDVLDYWQYVIVASVWKQIMYQWIILKTIYFFKSLSDSISLLSFNDCVCASNGQ